ncbi:MAG: hypothetical protein KIT18_11215 [Burkholderiales bacterium]|nr:hypothetical protein [Burkholderiales bacterium]
MIEVFLVILGFALGFGVDFVRRHRMKKAHWKILGAEIEVCNERAKWYLERTVSAPLYRLPTSAFSVSFPILVSEAAMDASEFSSLVKYYSWAEDINRGLEYAADAAGQGETERLKREENRLQKKCERFFSEFLQPAAETLKKHGVSIQLHCRRDDIRV